jgi:hypothetical protein
MMNLTSFNSSYFFDTQSHNAPSLQLHSQTRELIIMFIFSLQLQKTPEKPTPQLGEKQMNHPSLPDQRIPIMPTSLTSLSSSSSLQLQKTPEKPNPPQVGKHNPIKSSVPNGTIFPIWVLI